MVERSMARSMESGPPRVGSLPKTKTERRVIMKEPGLDGRHRDKDAPKSGEIQQKRGDTLNRNLDRPIPQFPGNTRLDTMDRGRVARPFGFALTDPGGRLSRTRLFPEVTRIRLSVASRGE